jgi:Domain of unknown function (DUF4157)
MFFQLSRWCSKNYFSVGSYTKQYHPSVNSVTVTAGKSFFQPKLAINNPNDKYEQEADTVADKVMQIETPSLQKKPVADSLISASPFLITPMQRKCDNCKEEEKMQRKEIDGEEITAQNNLENYVGGLQSGGQPLSKETRNFYEPRFGYDFSKVKIHTDNVAAKSAQSINALAYTSGSNIVFNSNQYSPNTDTGKRLLGHELTHVVQQSIQNKTIQRKPLPADLKLPCTWGDYEFTETTIEKIRLLSTTDKGTPIDSKILTAIAKQIKKDNELITDAAFQVKVCVISPGVTTRFTLLNDEPVLALDLGDVNVETVRHEMGHAIFNFFNNNRKHKIHGKIESENWLVTITDIFLQLNALTFKQDGSADEMYANNIVDPSIWKPGSKAEHPGDVDEFFGSAKEAYQTDKKALKAAFEKYGKQNKKIKELGERLFILLDFIFSKSELKSKNISSPTADISDHIKHLSKPSKMENTLASPSNVRVKMLLDPAERPRCK